MRSVRRIVGLCAALVLAASCACAELSRAELDDWYGQMRYFVEDIGARQVNTEGEREAAAYIYAQLEEMGYSEDEGTLHTYTADMVQMDNVQIEVYEAIRPALSEDANILIIGAHYDSWVPGARDNASGIAAMLMLARLFAARTPYENTELRFVAFSAEEYVNHEGSNAYTDNLLEEEKERVIAMFNLDIVTVGREEPQQVLSLDTLGMRTPDGYVQGSEEAPAMNRVALAVRRAVAEVGGFEEAGVDYCVPRHLGMSDHEAFDAAGIDAGNFCFRGNVAEGGHWPQKMHQESDTLDGLDIPRSERALQVLYTAVNGLAIDPSYGD